MEFKNLLTLITAVSDSSLSEFHFEENGTKIRFVRETQTGGQPFIQENPAGLSEAVLQQIAGIREGAQETETPEGQEGKLVKAPLVGTFYAAPAEDAPPFVTVGSTVKKGQTLGIVEAMKLMNEIESEFEGVVSEVLVENGQMVEFGQPLFRLK